MMIGNCVPEPPRYATQRNLVTERPDITDGSSLHMRHVFFLPALPGRTAAGGLRTKGLFKTSTDAKPLVTVITVVYNGAAFLEQTVESVINQKYDNLEYIVIDGGSTDGTLELLEKYDDAIDYWISEPDKGIYEAMNKAISCSSGKYLLFLNARDELFVDLRTIIDVLKRNYVLIYGKANMMEENRNIVYAKGKKLKNVTKLITGTPLCHQAIFYRRDAISTYNLNYKIMADRVLTYEMIKKYGISHTLFIDVPIANYFEGGFSRQNYDCWKKEEIVFLKSVGRHFYAEYKRLGWLWKKIKRGFIGLAAG